MKLLVLRHFRAQQTDDAVFFEKENATPPLWVYLLIKGVIFAPISCAYASKEELLDLEEEKSDIEDRIEERRARGQGCDDLEERRNDVQDEIDNVREEG